MILSSYSMSFTTGGLFLNESVRLAEAYRSLGDWQSAIIELTENATFAASKRKSMQRVGREIVNRLATLRVSEREFLVVSTSRTDQAALLWLAICRAYRLIREFAVEVVVERYDARQRHLPKERYDSFVHDKGEEDEWLAARSGSTIQRSRQVLFKIMREAGLINEVQEIQRLALSAPLRRLLEDVPQDHAVFPGGVRI